MKRLAIVFVLLSLLTVYAVSAQDAEPTAEPTVDHAAHHPTEEATSEATEVTAESEAALDDISETLDAMMQMEMPADMMAMMEQMQAMMGTMQAMGDQGRQGMMMGMMGMMMGTMPMDMPAEMQPLMDDMMRHMQDMMQSIGPDSMMGEPTAEESAGGMEMEMASAYSADDFAPLALAFYEGEEVYFIHPEASDEGVAGVLTEMMGPDVVTVPSLAQVPEGLLGSVYVFTNGIEAMGPLGFQPDVFDSVPGDDSYTPLRSIHLVTWADGVSAREIRSAAEIEEAEAAGDVSIETPGVVVNMPVLVWPGGQR